MSSELSISGVIVKIFPTVQVTEKFKKREFVLYVENGQYPQEVIFQVSQARCEELDKWAEGQHCKVQFNLRGRYWEKGEKSGYMNTLEAWRLSVFESATPAPTAPAPKAAPAPPAQKTAAAPVVGGGVDDLPF